MEYSSLSLSRVCTRPLCCKIAKNDINAQMLLKSMMATSICRKKIKKKVLLIYLIQFCKIQLQTPVVEKAIQ